MAYNGTSDSDLTEIDSEEEDELPIHNAALPIQPQPTQISTKATRPTTKAATLKSLERNMSKPNPLLHAPRTTTYSVEGLNKFLEQGTLDLDPDYQREIVWSDTKQSNLIDSLFHNYYIPPIIFAVKNTDDGGQIRTCIDGKQRLTSLHRYIAGEIPHRDSASNRRLWFTNLPGKKNKIIAPPLKMTFESKQIACVEYNDLTPAQEREIFQRVQMGVALTPKERLPASNGPHAGAVRKMKDVIMPVFLGIVNWDTKAKAVGFQRIAQIIYLISYEKTPTYEPTTMRLETFLNRKTMEAGLTTKVEFVMKALLFLAQEQGVCHNFRTGDLLPLEFVLIAYLIHLYKMKLSPVQISDALRHVQLEHRSGLENDKKSKMTTFKRMMDFVSRKVGKLDLQSDGKGDIPIGDKRRSLVVEHPYKPRDLTVESTDEPTDLERKRRLVHSEEDKMATTSKANRTPGPKTKKKKRDPLFDGSSSDDDYIVKDKPRQRPKNAAPRPLKVKTLDMEHSSKTTVKRTSPAKVKTARKVEPPTATLKPMQRTADASNTTITKLSATPMPNINVDNTNANVDANQSNTSMDVDANTSNNHPNFNPNTTNSILPSGITLASTSRASSALLARSPIPPVQAPSQPIVPHAMPPRQPSLSGSPALGFSDMRPQHFAVKGELGSPALTSSSVVPHDRLAPYYAAKAASAGSPPPPSPAIPQVPVPAAAPQNNAVTLDPRLKAKLPSFTRNTNVLSNHLGSSYNQPPSNLRPAGLGLPNDAPNPQLNIDTSVNQHVAIMGNAGRQASTSSMQSPNPGYTIPPPPPWSTGDRVKQQQQHVVGPSNHTSTSGCGSFARYSNNPNPTNTDPPSNNLKPARPLPVRPNFTAEDDQPHHPAKRPRSPSPPPSRLRNPWVGTKPQYKQTGFRGHRRSQR